MHVVRLVLDWYVPVGQGKEALQYLPRQGAHVCDGSCSLRLWSDKKPAVLLLPSTLTLTSPEGAVKTPDRKVGCCCSVPPHMSGTYISWLHSPGVKTFPGFHATDRLCVPHMLLLEYSTPREYTLPVVTSALVSRLVALATCMWHRRTVLFRLHCPAPSEFCAYHPLPIMAESSRVTDCVNPPCHWKPASEGRLSRRPYQVLFAPAGHETQGNPYSPPTRV